MIIVESLRNIMEFGTEMNKNMLIDDVNTGMSKYSMLLVVVTFVYSYFYQSFGPSLIEGSVFVVFGILLIPLVIGIPLNFLKYFVMYGTGPVLVIPKYGAQSILLASGLDKIGLFLVIGLTQWTYIYLFNN